LTIKKLCEQILRQLIKPMERRNDSNLLIIQSQIELISTLKEDNVRLEEKIQICNQLLRQLDVPMRRSDDWNLSVIKSKVKQILKELEERRTNSKEIKET
jgi:hypothetical protein